MLAATTLHHNHLMLTLRISHKILSELHAAASLESTSVHPHLLPPKQKQILAQECILAAFGDMPVKEVLQCISFESTTPRWLHSGSDSTLSISTSGS